MKLAVVTAAGASAAAAADDGIAVAVAVAGGHNSFPSPPRENHWWMTKWSRWKHWH